MSKVTAYRCDNCGYMNENADLFAGIDSKQNLFNPLKSFAVTATESAPVHICLECFRTRAQIPAENAHRRALQPESWQIKYEELSFILRRSAWDSYSKKQRLHIKK